MMRETNYVIKTDFVPELPARINKKHLCALVALIELMEQHFRDYTVGLAFDL